MGPAPKSAGSRRRRNATPNAVQLPAEGRQGDPPPWPLPGQSEDEALIWVDLWRTPQAVAWERLGWTRTVARYCRALVAAELPAARGVVLAEVRQMEDRLGLSPMSMLRLRWEIVTDELTPARATPAASSRRPRLKAVDTG